MAVKVGFLGGGLIARYHAMMLRLAEADAVITSVHDPDPAKVDTFVQETGAAVVDSEDAVLDAVDAVYVCTWTSEHPRLVDAAAARGLPVFCEKPLAVDLPTARAMIDTVETAGVINQVGLVMRDYPGFHQLSQLTARPEAGKVMSVVFRDDQYIPIQGMYASKWRADPSKSGAGTLIEHSVHDLDILEWLFGPVASVTARSSTVHGIQGIEDVVVATLAFDSGTLGTLTSVWHDVLDRPSLRRVEVFCENSYAVLEGDVFGPVRWTGPAGEAGELEGDALVEELKSRGVGLRNPDGAFIEAVTRGAPAHPAFSAALRAHVLVDAIYRSAAEGGCPVATPAEASAT